MLKLKTATAAIKIEVMTNAKYPVFLFAIANMAEKKNNVGMI
jgi:hypothetical protein